MRQSGAETLVTEEPYELIAHVRTCGGAGWETTGSTRKPYRGGFPPDNVAQIPPKPLSIQHNDAKGSAT
jgi:hypothetical protein